MMDISSARIDMWLGGEVKRPCNVRGEKNGGWLDLNTLVLSDE
jgi:hypothetical protein